MSGDLSVRLGHLNPASDRAVFRQIADHLRDGIERGQLSEGEQLPSEAQLIEHYGVARMTVRHAIQVLQGEGLVVAEHGRGVFCPSPAASQAARLRPLRPPSSRAGQSRVHCRGRTGRSVPAVDSIVVRVEQPAADVAAKLGSNGEVLARHRRYLLDGHPVETAISTFPSISPAGHRSPNPIPGRAESMPASKNSGTGSITLTKRSGPACLLLTRPRRCCYRPGSLYFIWSGRLMTRRTERWKSVDTVMSSDAYVLSYRLPAG